MLLIATSPGARGGTSVLQAAVTYFPYLGGHVVANFSLPNFHDNFSRDKISDDESNEELSKKVMLFERHLNN